MISICITIVLCVAIICITIMTIYNMKLNRANESNKHMELVGRRTEYNRHPWTKLEFEQELDDTLEKLKELQIYKQTEMQKYKEEDQNAD